MWLPTDPDRKSLHVLQTEFRSMNFFFKKCNVTCFHIMINSHLRILLLKLKWHTHVCKGYGMPLLCWNVIILKKPELYPAFSSLKANFAMPNKKTTVILWKLVQRHCYNNMDMSTQAKLAMNTALEHRE